jgi:hypothetical protein
MHDIQFDRGNIDHLVHGPGGTFLLETKCPRGRAFVVNGALVTSPFDDPQKKSRWKVAPQMTRQLEAIRRGRVPGVKAVANVQPVVVIWGTFDERIHEGGGIVFLHGDELADWLRSRLLPPLDPLTELV